MKEEKDILLSIENRLKAVEDRLKNLEGGIVHLHSIPMRVTDTGIDMELRCRELCLTRAIEEAVDSLEETRKAFKSKQIESIRKKLLESLIRTS